MKKLLLGASGYKQGERIYPIIPELSKHFEISLLTYHHMNPNKENNGSIDMRDVFYNKYRSYFSHIYRNWKSVDYSQFDCILHDDCRDKGEHIPTKLIYPYAKKHNITVFGSAHGNKDYVGNIHEVDHYKSVFDYCFLFGQWQKQACKNKDFLLLGGIPANDALKQYKRTNEYILIIPNYIDIERGPFPVRFGDKFIKEIKLFDLQQKYGKKIVVKLKPRDRHFAQGNPYMQDINFVEELLARNNIEGDVIRDIEDDNLMISRAHSVIGTTSTLCFKSVQMGIPTVTIKGGAFIGAFQHYRGLCELYQVPNVLDIQLKLPRDENFIDNIIEGGLNYDSTSIFIKSIIERL